jgi:N-acetylglutamate synthase-like GNAT family acetyltransferase
MLSEILIRKAVDNDAEAVSQVILAALHESNAKDYTHDIIERVEKNFTPTTLLALFRKRRVFVAALNDKIVGTASLDGRTVRSVFVMPDMQGFGIGKQLIEEIVASARSEGISILVVPSSVTAESFYSRLGFKAVQDSYYGDERTIIMERAIT